MQWYYVEGDQRVGPFEDAAIEALVQNGKISSSTRVWHEGMPDWVAAVNSELGKYLLSTPPPIHSAQPPAYRPGAEPEYLRKPDVLRTMWLWWIILCAAGFPLSFVYGIGYLLIIPGAIIGFMLLYRFWFIIQSGIPRTTPGKAVGYSFIPFYNFYWWYVAWVGLAKDMNAYCREKNIEAKVDEGMALTYYILLLVSIIPFVGIVTGIGSLVVGAILMKQFVETAVKIIQAG